MRPPFSTSVADLRTRKGMGMVTVPLLVRNTQVPPLHLKPVRTTRETGAESRWAMNYGKTNACAICGEGRSGIGTFFLLAENRWEDKLTILQWNEQMALRDGIQ